jgi:stress response protein SCP2
MAIKLSKGSSIRLTKDDDDLKEISIGCSWRTNNSNIDIDTMIFLVNTKAVAPVMAPIYYGNKSARGVIHYGDDTTGSNKQHESDNEVIFVDLSKIDSKIDCIPVVIDSYSLHNLLDVPSLKIRVYSGKPGNVLEVLGSYEVEKETGVKGKKYSILIGEFRKTNEEWNFKSVGEYLNASRISEITDTINARYKSSARVVESIPVCNDGATERENKSLWQKIVSFFCG